MLNSSKSKVEYVALVDRDERRCSAIADSLAESASIPPTHIFQCYMDSLKSPVIQWYPREQQLLKVTDIKIDLAFCHYQDAERKKLTEIKPLNTVYYSGSGGTSIPEEYVIIREVQPYSGLLSKREAEEIVKYFHLAKEQRRNDLTPSVLRREHPYAVQSLAVLCQIYLALYSRVHGGVHGEDPELTEILRDLGRCRDQLKALESPTWWLARFSGVDLKKQIEREWVSTRDDRMVNDGVQDISSSLKEMCKLVDTLVKQSDIPYEKFVRINQLLEEQIGRWMESI